jgi:hypothetical protein
MSNTAEVINFPIKTELRRSMADLSNGIPRSQMRYRSLPRLRMSGSRVAVS